MSYARLLSTFVLLAVCAAAQSTAAPKRSPVLIELFTSEGCSSCPPADRLLTELQQKQPVENAEVILLGFHVDYWDHLGWKDRFSSAQFTKRQEEYAARSEENVIYTPQIILDGVVRPFDPATVRAQIKQSAAEVKPVSLALKPGASGRLTITASANKGLLAYLAITEDDLQTQVKSGENGGHALVHNGVVRQLLPLGDLTAPKTVAIKVQSDWRKDHLRVVCFAQDAKSGKILGVTSVPAASLL